MNPLRPYSLPGQRRYCRLLPPGKLGSREGNGTAELTPVLSALVDRLEDDGTRPNNGRPDIAIQAGYTYFGQFIDHDLTNTASSLEESASLEPENTFNQNTPFLDLSHLYGKGPWDETDYQLYEKDDVRLRIGEKVDSVVDDSQGRRSFDLALGEDGYPLAADARASENIILRQITAVFARLHNAAVEQLRPVIKDKQRLFARARQQTAWQFQYFVRDDYLRAVLNPRIYEVVFAANRPMIHWDTFSIPIEFAVGAMRFGHSMVRNGYDLSNVTTKTLAEMTQRGTHPGALEPEWEIDWGRFLQNASRGGPATSAQPIDVKISPGLLNLSVETLNLFYRRSGTPTPTPVPPAPIKLPLVTLLRGLTMRLPSGQEAARLVGESVLTRDELTHNLDGTELDIADALEQHGLLDDTPLWFYILRESEVRENGSRLGPTGSRIVAETVHAALRYDPFSIMNPPEIGQKLPEWEFPSGKTQLRSLAALFDRSLEF